MKRGDIVMLQNDVHHVSGVYKAYSIGLVMKVSPFGHRTVAAVRFNKGYVRCHCEELEVLNETG